MLYSIVFYRAVAIILVVAGHFLNTLGDQSGSVFELFLVNLILGGTFLFVFISGFLFHHIFYSKFEYKNFLISKFKKVFIPYLVCGFLAVLLQVYSYNDKSFGFYLPSGTGWFNEIFIPVIKYYLTGGFLIAYWFIPFIMCMFLLSPLHVKFCMFSLRVKLFLFFLFSIISVFIQRPVDNFNVIQSLIYFFPIYLLGIICSCHRGIILGFFKDKLFLLLSLCVIASVTQSLVGEYGSYHKQPFDFGSFDLLFVQKISMCLFLFVLLENNPPHNNSIVTSISNASFAIYFIHPYFVLLVSLITKKYQLDVGFYVWPLFFILIFLVMLLCVMILKLTKYMFKSYSRYLLGA